LRILQQRPSLVARDVGYFDDQPIMLVPSFEKAARDNVGVDAAARMHSSFRLHPSSLQFSSRRSRPTICYMAFDLEITPNRRKMNRQIKAKRT
jgi:hypothetical protein